ncbi:flagellar biosynthesis anti-sigma factor FlgM [Halalkalibacterium ligniniphilum]|uniref:flagellar biosynthesis anti-sigma factor FlgM n=1 Tax=Halalkalibacterium ligniniphilum TaxID=1134413 RepID=UPI00034515BC|nr:flagellar biosynthesis anti-sigma factor FlgM [Halalkalibacterium ligniniphilum]
MKINPFQSVQSNPYRKQVEKQEQVGKTSQKRDRLEISEEAKIMQQGNHLELERAEKVEAIKRQVEAGEYKVNPKAVANKLYDFWNS